MSFSLNEAMPSHPKLVLTSQDEEFDPVTIRNWHAEGFQVSYLPYTGTRKAFERELQYLHYPLELGEKYAIVAYGDAAMVVLDVAQKPMPKLCTLVVYYPTKIPAPAASYPSSLDVVVHLTESQTFGPKYRSYAYPDTEPGFAEVDLEVYNKLASGLAWSRTLAAVRKGFGIEVDLEKVWEEHIALEFVTKDVDATMSTMVEEPYVNHIPTITGGIGYKDLHRFYRDYFIPGNPPSLRMKLISRTVGTDRIVDELYLSFRHTQEVPWMLPGVKPTDKDVEVALVVVVCIRGGKLYHEHIYWDQASVLVQLGLLDPKLVPGDNGNGQLPVVDGTGAKKVLDESVVPSNALISNW
ncbi:MAG: hypothetical protein Q9217_004485 [Psora testacea]